MPPQLNEIVGEAIKHCLAEGIEVDLEGLGTFRRTDARRRLRANDGTARVYRLCC